MRRGEARQAKRARGHRREEPEWSSVGESPESVSQAGGWLSKRARPYNGSLAQTKGGESRNGKKQRRGRDRWDRGDEVEATRTWRDHQGPCRATKSLTVGAALLMRKAQPFATQILTGGAVFPPVLQPPEFPTRIPTVGAAFPQQLQPPEFATRIPTVAHAAQTLDPVNTEQSRRVLRPLNTI